MSLPTPASDTPAPPFDVLCVGLLCLDLVLGVPHHPAPDEKLRATTRLVSPGGPAAVAAGQIARLGGRAAFAGLLGDPAHDPLAPLLRRTLAEAGLDLGSLHEIPRWPTPLASILVKPDASRSVASHHSAPPAESVTKLVTLSGAADSARPFARPFPVARVLLADGHRPEWHDALLAHAHATAAPLVLDAGSFTPSIRALAPHADHLVASEACARAALSGRDPAAVPPAELRAALLARRDALLVVTLGPRGLLWQIPAQPPESVTKLVTLSGSSGEAPPRSGAPGPDPASGMLPAFRIDAVDTTGAGDAFHGAYALALARGLPFAEILRHASAAGALTCTRPGAWPALPCTAEHDALLATLPLDKKSAFN